MVALGELAGVDAEEDELADEGVGPELERERAELARCRRRERTSIGSPVVRVHALGRRNVERAREDNRRRRR